MPRRDTPGLFASADPSPSPAPAEAPGAVHGLTIAAQGDAALSPEQRKYNQLVAKVETARADLQAWDNAARAFAQEHRRQMLPQMVELAAWRRRLVLKLAALLAQPGAGGASKRDRRTLTRCLCEGAAMLADNAFADTAAAAEMEALHDQYADTSLADERRAALAEMKTMLQAMSGVDLSDIDVDSEEDLMRQTRQRMQAAAAAAEPAPIGVAPETTVDRWQTPDLRKRKKKRAQKQAEEHAQAMQSVREVYRKLASALHPDRAADDTDRARRTALMQRVNQAYEAQDLLALFTLQLEIEQIDPEHLARAGSERIRHYNRVLGSQLADLQNELLQRTHAFGIEFAVEPFRKLDPRRLDAVLQDLLGDIGGALNQVALDLGDLNSTAGIKRFIRRERELQRMHDNDGFDLPF